jgi:hypothetical protein
MITRAKRASWHREVLKAVRRARRRRIRAGLALIFGLVTIN